MSFLEILVKCGGRKAVMQRCAVTSSSITGWRSRGIPLRHWATLIEMSRGDISYEALRVLHMSLPLPSGTDGLKVGW